MIRIRDMTADDLDTFVSLGKRMHNESIEPYPPIDPDFMQKYLEMAVSMPEIFLFAIAEDDGVPMGMVAAVAGPYSFSPEIRAASDLLFVLPEHRGSRAAIKLVQKFKGWSDSVGARTANLSVATGVSPERTGRFFELMGFRPMQKTYQRDRDVYGI